MSVLTPTPAELAHERRPRAVADGPRAKRQRLAAIRQRLAADLDPRGATETVLVERIAGAVADLEEGEGDIVAAAGYGRLAGLIRDRRYLCARDIVMRYGGRPADELWLRLRALRLLQSARELALGERPSQPARPFSLCPPRNPGD